MSRFIVILIFTVILTNNCLAKKEEIICTCCVEDLVAIVYGLENLLPQEPQGLKEWIDRLDSLYSSDLIKLSKKISQQKSIKILVSGTVSDKLKNSSQVKIKKKLTNLILESLRVGFYEDKIWRGTRVTKIEIHWWGFEERNGVLYQVIK